MCLFVDRATAALPAFALTEQNAPAVAQICRRLDGIPLALELAAARVKALPVETIAARLDDRFHLLTAGSRTALPRHRTLRALIDWSYDLLSEAERTLLRRLSVFSGGWTLEAAEAVWADQVDGGWLMADGPDRPEPSTINYQRSTHGVLDLLTALVEKSLVEYEGQSGEGRYRLLETVRQYGQERLAEAQEVEVMRGRHLEFFVRWAEEEAEPKNSLGARSAETLVDRAQAERVETEHDNLRAALRWSQMAPDGATPGLRLAAALWGLLEPARLPQRGEGVAGRGPGPC